MAVTGPYAILFLAALFLSVAVTGNTFIPNLTTGTGLEYAGRFPVAVTIGSIGDGLQHIAFFVTFVAVFSVVRSRWPVWGQLILVGGAGTLILALTKTATFVHMAIGLGAAYLAAGAAGHPALLPLGGVVAGIRQGLQDMDTYSLMATWLFITLLPQATGLPRSVRWLGVVMAGAFLIRVANLGFLITSLLLPIWAFLLGRWLLAQEDRRSGEDVVVPPADAVV
jgi:hypothetical protein